MSSESEFRKLNIPWMENTREYGFPWDARIFGFKFELLPERRSFNKAEYVLDYTDTQNDYFKKNGPLKCPWCGSIMLVRATLDANMFPTKSIEISPVCRQKLHCRYGYTFSEQMESYLKERNEFEFTDTHDWLEYEGTDESGNSCVKSVETFDGSFYDFVMYPECQEDVEALFKVWHEKYGRFEE